MDGIQCSTQWHYWIFSYIYYSFLFTSIDVDVEDNFLGETFVDSFATCILHAKYEQVNIHDVAFNQQHLLLDQYQELFNILS